MQIIPLQAIPSQTLSYIDPAGNQWNIAVRLVGQQIAFSFTLNNIVLIQGITAVAGARIIPYNYLESGNFALITQAQQVPDYTQFGITQTLVFFEPADILASRQSLRDLSRIVPSDFDPNGAEPLRFAPAGYALA